MEWNNFYCGDNKGCPYSRPKCDPDICGFYFHYKAGDWWKIENGKPVFISDSKYMALLNQGGIKMKTEVLSNGND